ncbi:MAG: hypothetical protein GX053_12340 [Tissierella sp.]|nr:hypothetical protein [Tissierella sp.]
MDIKKFYLIRTVFLMLIALFEYSMFPKIFLSRSLRKSKGIHNLFRKLIYLIGILALIVSKNTDILYNLLSLQQASVVLYIFYCIKNLYSNEILYDTHDKIKLFLGTIAYSIIQFTLIYFVIYLLENKNLVNMDDNMASYEVTKMAVDSFSFSVSNYLNMEQLSKPASSLTFKLMASMQQIFSFITIIIGLSFFINKDKQQELT